MCAAQRGLLETSPRSGCAPLLVRMNSASVGFLVKGGVMSLKHILGLDHVVVTVRDLDASARQWERLGFTVSPRGTHSPILGTGNYTIMFGDDYVELLGILAETEHNKPTRDFLKEREG